MKKIFTTIMSFLLMMGMLTPALAASQSQIQPLVETTAADITAKSAIAVDQETGQILYDKDSSAVRPIASMSKVISAYLIMKSVKEGKMTWNQKVSVNKSLEEVSEDKDLTNVPLDSTREYTVKELFDASLIYSANAAILALGKTEAGSSEKFVNKMRSTVEQWGIHDAKLYNAAGLLENQVGTEKYPQTADNVENEMSAKDMAIVVAHVLKEFPEILKVTSVQSADFNTGTEKLEMINHNEMLKDGEQYDQKYQLDGLKTGTSEKAGENFAATGLINKRRVISIVMGSKEDQRFKDTKKIWDPLMSRLVLKKTDLKNESNVKMNSAEDGKVSLRLSVPFDYWAKKDDSTKLTLNKIELNDKKQIPFSAGETVATGYLSLNDSNFLEGSKSGPKVALASTQSVKKANILVQIGRTIADWFG